MIALYPSAPRVPTTLGTPVGARPRLSPEARFLVRVQLEMGPFLAAHDARIDLMRDIYWYSDRATRLVTVEDD